MAAAANAHQDSIPLPLQDNSVASEHHYSLLLSLQDYVTDIRVHPSSMCVSSQHLAAAVQRAPLPLPPQQAESVAAVADDANNSCGIYFELDNNFSSAMFSTSSEVMTSSHTIDQAEDDRNYERQTHGVTVGGVFKQRLNYTEYLFR